MVDARMFEKYVKFKTIKQIISNPNNLLCPKEVKIDYYIVFFKGCTGFV